MFKRVSIVSLSLLLLFLPQLHAKNKKKQLLPDIVLQAQRVLVVIEPDAVESVTNPRENRTAQNEVENAITKWGRFQLTTDPQAADLIIAVRKGDKGGPIIRHSPVDHPPVVFEPGIADASVGQATTRRSPDLSEPTPGNPRSRGPQLGSQLGPTEDTFEVYIGRGEYPLDAPPLWRYVGKGSLDAPTVAAVDQFRKAIEESEKDHKP
jgi:hypothetical protein